MNVCSELFLSNQNTLPNQNEIKVDKSFLIQYKTKLTYITLSVSYLVFYLLSQHYLGYVQSLGKVFSFLREACVLLHHHLDHRHQQQAEPLASVQDEASPEWH